MTKPTTLELAELFAEAWTKGHEVGAAHGLRLTAKQASRLAYAQKRAVQLARWRKYAIERLGIGGKLVQEIDRESKRSLVRRGVNHESSRYRRLD